MHAAYLSRSSDEAGDQRRALSRRKLAIRYGTGQGHIIILEIAAGQRRLGTMP